MRTIVASLALVLAGTTLAAQSTAAAGEPSGAIAQLSGSAAQLSDSAAAPNKAKAYVPPPIDWGKCAEDYLADAKARCGDLIVPLDYANPTGETISLAVARVKRTAKRDRGVMFTNPGGPGGAGRWVATLGQYVPGKVAGSYDWIGMDPRGVGESSPALSCDRKYFSFNRPAYVPNTSAIRDAWITRTQNYAADCGTSKAAKLLGHVKTTDTVADFESLRVALGEEKASFYGFSYGTYIAQVYATLHPDRLDKLVLDGVVDASRVWYQGNLDQDLAFEKAMGRFFGWIAKHNRDYKMGTTRKKVTKAYFTLLGKLKRKPLKGVGPAELTDAVLGAGYNVNAWEDTATILAATRAGKAGPARRAYRSDNPTTPGGDNGYAMYLATQCTDAAWPTDWGTWETDNWAMHGKAPYVTWSNAWFNAPCRTWPAAPGTPVAVNGSAFTGDVLLISETYDAATPFSGALATRRLFPTASLIEGVGGTTHSASLFGIGCVDDTIAAYLKNGKAPERKAGNKSDLKCESLKPPTPGGTARAVVRRPAAGVIR